MSCVDVLGAGLVLTVLRTCACVQLAQASSRYPGPAFLRPRIHHSPDCAHTGGWHDIAAALSLGGTHHVFQGCPQWDGTSGWSHSTSTDYVHWTAHGIGPHARNETYAGMASPGSGWQGSPCSGFVTVGQDGIPCAGFRQCTSTHGTTELNPAAQRWDVPLELRCAEDARLAAWGALEYILPLYYDRALPYDPARAWQDADDKLWYLLLATDACNATTRALPCKAGGRLALYSSPALRGPGAAWRYVGPMFTVNGSTDGLGHLRWGSKTKELTSPGYFSGLPGDPATGGAAAARSRVVTEGVQFWVGTQPGGVRSPLRVMWNRPGAVGRYDYGRLQMARTLGKGDQVTESGRRVLVGWTVDGDRCQGSEGNWLPCVAGHTELPASQGLARDLSLSSTYELLQRFVPELQTLRIPHPAVPVSSPSQSARTTRTRGATRTPSLGHRQDPGSLQAEVLATFRFPEGPSNCKACVGGPLGVSILRSPGGASETRLGVRCSGTTRDTCVVGDLDACVPYPETKCKVGNTTQWCYQPGVGPLLPAEGPMRELQIHVIVDGAIVEVIFNNRTAMVIHANVSDPAHTGVALIGVDDKMAVQANLQTWALRPANNWT